MAHLQHLPQGFVSLTLRVFLCGAELSGQLLLDMGHLDPSDHPHSAPRSRREGLDQGTLAGLYRGWWFTTTLPSRSGARRTARAVPSSRNTSRTLTERMPSINTFSTMDLLTSTTLYLSMPPPYLSQPRTSDSHLPRSIRTSTSGSMLRFPSQLGSSISSVSSRSTRGL